MAVKVKPITGEKRTRLLRQKMESDGIVAPVSTVGHYIFQSATVDRLDGETQDGRVLSKVEAVALIVKDEEGKKFRISIGNLNKECREALLRKLADIDSGAASGKLGFIVSKVIKSKVIIKEVEVGDRYELIAEITEKQVANPVVDPTIAANVNAALTNAQD